MRENENHPKRLHWPAILLSAVILLLALALHAGAAQAADGKTLFVDQGCNKCHSLVALGVEVLEDEEEAEDEDPFAEEEEEAEPGDLSGIGARWEHDGAKGLQKYLMKKLEVDGERHKKRFKGDPKELKVLTEWLMTLTEPAPSSELAARDRLGQFQDDRNGAPRTPPLR